MIRLSDAQRKTAVRLAAGLAILASVSACTKDEDTDYCKNHYVYHFEHREQLTSLDLEVSGNGLITARLALRGDTALDFDPGAGQGLLDSRGVYHIDTEGECTDATVTQDNSSGTPVLTFESQCAAGVKIDQVNVTLFDTLPELDEIEATIKTPATSKHFAISRQCDGAIFRLAKKQDKP